MAGVCRSCGGVIVLTAKSLPSTPPEMNGCTREVVGGDFSSNGCERTATDHATTETATILDQSPAERQDARSGASAAVTFFFFL